MNPEDRKEYRDYAWRYFEVHADQRLKVFNFFIIFASLTVGAFSTLVAENGLQTVYFLLPAAMVFFSFIFWKFDERTRMLIRNGEKALRYLDELDLSVVHSPLYLFRNDDEATESLKKWPLTTGYFSYSRIFRSVYGFFGVVGALGVLLCFTAT